MRIKQHRDRWRVHYDGREGGPDRSFFFDFLLSKNVRKWLRANTQKRWAFCPSREHARGYFSFGTEDEAALFLCRFGGYVRAPKTRVQVGARWIILRDDQVPQQGNE